MALDRPYRPAPELQQVLDDLERLGNPLDRMTRDTVADLWRQREALAARRLAPLPLAGVRDAWVPARNRVIPVRIDAPADRGPACGGRLPVLVYDHGGAGRWAAWPPTTASAGPFGGRRRTGRVGGLPPGAAAPLPGRGRGICLAHPAQGDLFPAAWGAGRDPNLAYD